MGARRAGGGGGGEGGGGGKSTYKGIVPTEQTAIGSAGLHSYEELQYANLQGCCLFPVACLRSLLPGLCRE